MKIANCTLQKLMAFPLEQYEWMPKPLAMSFLGLSPQQCVALALGRQWSLSLRRAYQNQSVRKSRLATLLQFALQRKREWCSSAKSKASSTIGVTLLPNPAVNRTLRDKAAQRRLLRRWAS